MTGELDIYGVFVPGLFAWVLIAFGIYLMVHRIRAGSGYYGLVWHRPHFDVALYIVLLGIVVLFALRLVR